MFRSTLASAMALLILTSSAGAQCFNRELCADKSVLEVHSQISVNVGVPDSASSSDEIKVMEDARRELYALSNRECDTLRAVFGGDCTLASVNLNSSIQDRGMRSRSAFVSLTNNFVIKRAPK